MPLSATSPAVRLLAAVQRLPGQLAVAALAVGVLAAVAGRRAGTPAAQPRPRARSSLAGPSLVDPGAVPGAAPAGAAIAEPPDRSWWGILSRTVTAASRDRLLAVAGGVAFYALLALFPAITALVSLYGLAFDPQTVLAHLAALSAMLPPGAFGIVEDQVARVTGAGTGGLTAGFLAGLGIALWSATAGVKAMFDALNVIEGVEEERSFVALNLTALAFTLGTIGMFMLFVGAVVVLPLVLSVMGLTGAGDALWVLLRWPFLFAALIGALALLYRFGPTRLRTPRRRHFLSLGAVTAAVLWIAVSLLFSLYLQNFTDYNAVYGSLGAVIGLMTWIWLSAAVVLLGAELDVERAR